MKCKKIFINILHTMTPLLGVQLNHQVNLKYGWQLAHVSVFFVYT